jgi:hypothetical protein
VLVVELGTRERMGGPDGHRPALLANHWRNRLLGPYGVPMAQLT